MKSCARFIKSTYIDTSTLTANTIYRLGRSTSDEQYVVPDYVNDPYLPFADQDGLSVQNKTNGSIYIWYGPLPAEVQGNPTLFKDVAFELGAGETYIPLYPQNGLVYTLFTSPAAGHIHHLVH